MRKLFLSCCSALLVCFSVSFATDLVGTRGINDLCHDGNLLLQATEGGLIVSNDEMVGAKRFDNTNGLHFTNVHHVAVDTSGLIWVANAHEILGVRLNLIGNKLTVVQSSVFSGEIFEVVYAGGGIWVLVDGLFIYGFDGKTWNSYQSPSAISSIYLKTDVLGDLWMTSENKAYCFSTNTKTFIQTVTLPPYFTNGALNSFAVVAPNLLLFSFYDDEHLGTFQAIFEGGVWSVQDLDADCLYFQNDSYGNVFTRIGNEINVLGLGGDFGNVVLKMAPTRVDASFGSAIETYASGNIEKMWIADWDGLTYYKKANLVFADSAFASSAPYSFNTIQSVTVDRDGNVWIFEQMRRFLEIFNPKTGVWKNQDMKLDGITSATVNVVARSSNGDIWAATNSEAVRKKADGTWTKSLGKGGTFIYTGLKDWVWTTGDSNKVHAYSYAQDKWSDFRLDCRPESEIRQIAAVAADEFYVLTDGSMTDFGSLFRYHQGNWEKINIPITLSCFLRANNGTICLGTKSAIYSTKDGTTWNVFQDGMGGLAYIDLYYLEIAPTGNIFVGTNNGVFVGNGKTWARTTNSPLISPMITGITFDETNNLIWYFGPEGISNFSWSGSTGVNPIVPGAKSSQAVFNLSSVSGKIRYDLAEMKGPIEFNVYLPSGKLVARQAIAENIRTGFAELPKAANGKYICQVKTGQGTYSKIVSMFK